MAESGKSSNDLSTDIEEYIDEEISSMVPGIVTEDAGVDDSVKTSIFKGTGNVLVRMAVIIIMIVYEELMFHFLSIGFLSIENDISYLPVKLVLCLPTAVFLVLFTTFLPMKAAKVIEAVIIGLIEFYYSVNLLYHSAFKTYFSIKLIDSSNAKIAQYYREIWHSIKLNSWRLALMILIPVAVYVLLRVFKIIGFSRVNYRLWFINVAAIVLAVGASWLVVYSYGTEQFSPYELIVGENVSDFSFPRLGVLATSEIELKNLIFPNKAEEEEEFEVWHYDPAQVASGGNGGYGLANSSNTGSGSANGSNTGSGSVDSSNGGSGSASSNGGSGTVNGNADNNSNNTGAQGRENEEKDTQDVVIDTSPNMLELDFVALAENESNSEIANIHKYFSSVEPSYKNQYTGMFEGYNLIFLTCEAFCPLAVDEELTPTLYKLVNEGFVFNNFYNPRTMGSTSDGEFVNSTSLVPTNSGATNFKIVGQHSMPFALGNQFNMTYGITSRAYHNSDYTYYDRHLTYPGMGYYYTGIGNGMNISWSWPESDLEMMEATVSDYIDDELFHVYYMTVSGHMNYNFGGNAMSAKHRDEVKDLPYSAACQAYIACQMELDDAMEYLLARLEEKGIADRTVICFTGDHWPYGLTNEQYSELLGHEVEPDFELFKSNLVLWSGSIKEPIVVDKYCSSMDILPTLLNLFGFQYDSRLLMGRDILSDTEGFVIFINRSFITDRIMYNSMNGQITYLTDEELPEGYIENARNTLNNRWKYSQKIMDTDYYKYISMALGIEIPMVQQNY